jgi:hypothetical protein
MKHVSLEPLFQVSLFRLIVEGFDYTLSLNQSIKSSEGKMMIDDG